MAARRASATQQFCIRCGAGTKVESFAVQPGMVRTDLWNQDKTDVKGKWAAFITGRAPLWSTQLLARSPRMSVSYRLSLDGPGISEELSYCSCLLACVRKSVRHRRQMTARVA